MRIWTALTAATLLAFACSVTLAQGQGPKAAKLDCSVGPLKRAYGGSDWLVYSCSDGRSLVVVSAPGSRAMPFYFMFGATGEGHRLVGEGTGDRAVTDRAFAELKTLSESDLNLLISETRAPRAQ